MRPSIAVIQDKISSTSVKLIVYAIAGTLVPLIFHSYGLAGPRFLPIFLFTLIGAVTISPAAALAVALITPVANNLLTGMPAGPMLLIVIVKGFIIAGMVKLLSDRLNENKILFSAVLVLAYQVAGLFIEAVFLNSFSIAWQHFVFSWPGMVIQVAVLNIIFKLHK